MDTTVQQAIAALAGGLVGVGVMGTADHFTRDRSLWPRPLCSACGAARRRLSWIPVLGSLATRGRCARCDAASAWPLASLVQVLGAVLAVLLLRRYGATPMLLSAAVETSVLLAVAVVDLQHRLIPTMLVYPTILFAVLSSPAWPNLGFLTSLLGGALAFALFFVLALVARLVFGEGALGDGDVTLATLIGVICGYPTVVLSLALGALAGGVGAFLLLLIRRSALGTAIPYGPYLVIGVVYVILTGNTMHPLYSTV